MLKKIVFLTALLGLNLNGAQSNSKLSSTDIKKITLGYTIPIVVNSCLAYANFSKPLYYYFAIKSVWLIYCSALCYATALKKDAQEKNIDNLSTSYSESNNLNNNIILVASALCIPFIEMPGVIDVLLKYINKI